MAEHHIDLKIVGEIEQKKKELDAKEQCFLSLLVSKHYRKYFEKSSILHSFKIEFPSNEVNKYSFHPSGKEYNSILKNLKEAYRWANSNFSLENLNEDFLKTIAGKLNPSKSDGIHARFRTEREKSIIGGANFTPPYGKDFLGVMEYFLKELEEKLQGECNLEKYLEASCFAHLHLVRIHPFVDGNGRTARVLQNVILKKVNLPPVDIFPGERFDYYKRIEEAIGGYDFRKGCGALSKQEISLYNYFAGKISSSLDLLLEK